MLRQNGAKLNFPVTTRQGNPFTNLAMQSAGRFYVGLNSPQNGRNEYRMSVYPQIRSRSTLSHLKTMNVTGMTLEGKQHYMAAPQPQYNIPPTQFPSIEEDKDQMEPSFEVEVHRINSRA